MTLAGDYKLRTCQACGQHQPSRWFTWNGQAKTYSPHCKLCTRTHKLFVALLKEDEAAAKSQPRRLVTKEAPRSTPKDHHPLWKAWNAAPLNSDN